MNQIKKNWLSRLSFFFLLLGFMSSSYALVGGLGIWNRSASLYISSASVFDKENIYYAGLKSHTGQKATMAYAGIGTGHYSPTQETPLFYSFSIQAYWIRGVKNKKEDRLFSKNYLAYDRPSGTMGYGLSVGASLGFQFLTPIPSAIVFRVNASPDPINGSDIEQYYEYALSYEAAFTPSVIGFLGYYGDQAVFEKKNLYRGDFSSNRSMLGSFSTGIRIRL